MKRNKVKPRFSDFRNILYVVVFLLIPIACASQPGTAAPTLSVETKIPTLTGISAVTPIYLETPQTIPLTKECIASFETFAYTLPEWDRSVETERIPPLPPWQVEGSVPDPTQKDVGDIVSVKRTRTIDGQVEVWVLRKIFFLNDANEEIYEFMIYWPDTNEWKIISGEIEDTGVFVDGLYITKDGVIYGRNTWNPYADIDVDKVPVLSVYNEISERFEFVQELPHVPVVKNDYKTIISNPNIILLDKQGTFWIFIQKDGLYSYDPASQKVRQEAKISDFYLGQAALAPDGSIYILRSYSYRYFRLEDGDLLQFIPETSELISLEIPDEPWPRISRIFIDHTGRLWLDSIGWRESDGTWHIMHPDPEALIERIKHGDGGRWTTPKIFLESSNGILWLRKGIDMDRIFNGIAWFNPQTSEGCLFTNYNTKIVEDAEGNLWMIADGKLYKYDLYP